MSLCAAAFRKPPELRPSPLLNVESKGLLHAKPSYDNFAPVIPRSGDFAVEALLEDPSCKGKARLSVLTHCNTGESVRMFMTDAADK